MSTDPTPDPSADPNAPAPDPALAPDPAPDPALAPDPAPVPEPPPADAPAADMLSDLNSEEFANHSDAILRDPNVPGDVRQFIASLVSVSNYLSRVKFNTDENGFVTVGARE